MTPGSPGSGNIQNKADSLIFFAFDTSGSARSRHEAVFANAKRTLMSIEGDVDIMIYRFDVAAAEAHSGPPPGLDEEASLMLNTLLTHTTSAKGTNLARVFAQIDKFVKTQDDRRFSVIVYTDCGYELMTQKDDALVKKIATEWSVSGDLSRIEFIGVADGHRERLRGMLPVNPDQLVFKSLNE